MVLMIEDLYRRPYHEYLNDLITQAADEIEANVDILLQEVNEWENSNTRKMMLTGERYYKNHTDLKDLKKERTLDWQSNLKLEHSFARKLVDQKTGYLLSKEPSIQTENDSYADALKEIYNFSFFKKLKNLGKEAINKGIAYLYVYYDETGELSFAKFPSEQILPFWKDSEHTEIYSFARVYEESIYMNGKKQVQKKVEYHHSEGVQYFVVDGGKLILDVPAGVDRNYHFMLNGKPHLWERLPLIPFKYNEEEQPLIDIIKSLVDNYNIQASTNADLLADLPNFIYILENYGGVDLKEFLSDLRQYRAAKVESDGDLRKLQAEPQTASAETETERARKSVYEFGRGIDTQDDEIGNASGVALRYRYSDLDMDCDNLESEFQSSIEQLMWFVNTHLLLTGKGDFTNEVASLIFNRDIIINETETIENASASIGVLDDKTIRENHPWYTPEVEDRLKEQEAKQKKEQEDYEKAFPLSNRGGIDAED